MQLKKIALVFLVVIMMFSLAAIGIAAEGAGSGLAISAKVESDSAISTDPFAVKPGDIIKFVISVDSNPGNIEYIDVEVEYDATALKYEAFELGDIFEKNQTATTPLITQPKDANGKITCWLFANDKIYSPAQSKTGMYMTLTFKVLESFDGDIETLDVTNTFYSIFEGSMGVLPGVDLPAVKAHNYGEPKPVAGDCMNVGTTVYECTKKDCDEVLTLHNGELGSHKCETLVPAVAPDCVTDGNVAHYVCGNAGCGKYIAEDKTTVLESIVDPMTGHKCENLVPAEAPDCVTDGKIAHYVCGNAGCGKYIAEDKTTILESIVDPKIGHKCETLVPAVAPDCVKDGNIAYYVCGNAGCGKYIAEDKTTILTSIVDPKIGHKCETLNEANAPTCAATGNVAYYVCANEGCGKYIAEDKVTILDSIEVAIDPSAHKCETLVEAIAPDCLTPGQKAHYVCANEGCGKYIAEDKVTVLDDIVVPATGHKCDDDKLVSAVAPGCETEGNVAYYVCGNEGCGKYIAEDKVTILDNVVVSASGHTYGELVAKVPATTEKEGAIAHYLCSACGKYFDASKAEVSSIVIPKLPKMISVPEEPWVKGSDDSLSFVSNAKFEDFVSVKLNGALLSESDYKLEKTDDGTKVTLEPATLEKLEPADYTITITSANGSCDAGFTVENSSAVLTIVIVVIAIVVIVAGAAAAIVVLKKKNII